MHLTLHNSDADSNVRQKWYFYVTEDTIITNDVTLHLRDNFYIITPPLTSEEIARVSHKIEKRWNIIKWKMRQIT